MLSSGETNTNGGGVPQHSPFLVTVIGQFVYAEWMRFVDRRAVSKHTIVEHRRRLQNRCAVWLARLKGLFGA